ncbi:histone methylation protein DOT1-domain-containing protein [Mycena pura]|uniref:Histone-lysine N-methyltransferase, H3 lysine-79 specific n=1 Tax=Mycena pura TaxID=153505 RepID=A0AAD6Y3I9_9AGAR|nr:histone methylation protein DOT1-domain-containing protein [Mycena pura]
MPKGSPIFDWHDKYSDRSSPRRPDMKPPGNEPQVDYLQAVQNTIETRDGPAFLELFAEINSILQQLKCSTSHPENALIQVVRGWSSLPKVVVLRVMTETYNRCVIPHWKELRRYQAFSSEAYGELMPSLVYKICQHTALSEHSLFIDLGSGVGNVIAQASLQTGCRSFGIEIKPNRASIACDVMNDFRARCHMWGLQPGEIELAERDMRSNLRVHELVKQADVVLVNNRIFEETFELSSSTAIQRLTVRLWAVHQAIKTQVLNKVKPGAYVVCLRAFGCFRQKTQEKWVCPTPPSAFKISAHLRLFAFSFAFSFAYEEYKYEPDDISWGSKGGSYYVYHRKQQPSQGEYLRCQPDEANSRSAAAAFSRSVATSCAQEVDLLAAEAEQSSLVYQLSQKLATHTPARPTRVEHLPSRDDDVHMQEVKEELEAAQAEQLGLLCQMSWKFETG